jgi:hypothetical protein
MISVILHRVIESWQERKRTYLRWFHSSSLLKSTPVYGISHWKVTPGHIWTVWAYPIEFMKFLLVLRQFLGDHCRTVFSISDIIRVHPAPSFLLPSTLQIHIRHNNIFTWAHDYNWTKESPYCVLCHLSYSISYRSSGSETVAPINVPSRDDHHIMSRIVSRLRQCALRLISSREPNKMDIEHVTKVNIKHREYT